MNNILAVQKVISMLYGRTFAISCWLPEHLSIKALQTLFEIHWKLIIQERWCEGKHALCFLTHQKPMSMKYIYYYEIIILPLHLQKNTVVLQKV